MNAKLAALLIALTFSASAQTNSILVTNYIAPTARHRIVGTNVYDITVHPKWLSVQATPDLICPSLGQGNWPAPGTRLDLAFLKVVATPPYGSRIPRHYMTLRNIPYNPQDFHESNDGILGKNIHPAGQFYRVCYLKSDYTYNPNGTVEWTTGEYDFGMPATNAVPVVRRVLVPAPAAKTNSIAGTQK